MITNNPALSPSHVSELQEAKRVIGTIMSLVTTPTVRLH